MSRKTWTKRDPIKNYFPLPNEIYSLGLSPGAIVVYGYLMRQEDRKTYQNRAGGPGSDSNGAHHCYHLGRPHPQRLSPLPHPAHPDVHQPVL